MDRRRGLGTRIGHGPEREPPGRIVEELQIPLRHKVKSDSRCNSCPIHFFQLQHKERHRCLRIKPNHLTTSAGKPLLQ